MFHHNDHPELGKLPQDLAGHELPTVVFISCGEMMCLSLPKSLPGVYQHYLTSSNSVIFFFINMSKNIEL